MPLTPGTKLGQYEVIESIGAGGMGEVYRARDTKLGRDVAIKVLPEEFARDKERLDRFEREARLLAQLNHSNIATLHGLEEHDGQQFLVMELVEGETLAERIAQGPVPVDEAIPLFIQIAEGLEAAHEKGIIHRDLKPANIKIGPDEKPKILDFGLAKAFEGDTEVAPDSSRSPTLTKGTALGAIMGTASYMSPEQARGKVVDKRTDIWAFGCCLYEALTARKTYEGETVTDTLAKVVQNEPDFDTVPNRVRGVIEKTLRKDVRQRFQHVGDVRIELQDTEREATRPGPIRSPFLSLPLTLALVGALCIAVWGWLRRPTQTLSGVVRSMIELPYPLSSGTNRPVIEISRDGKRMLAIVDLTGATQVYVRDLAQSSGRLLPGTEGVLEAFFSPDGQSVGFVAADTYLNTVSLLGGAPVRGPITSPVTRGAAWVTADKIVLNPSINDGLTVISGKERSVLTFLDIEGDERSHRWPHAVPGSDEVVFTVSTTGSIDQDRIAVVSLGTGRKRVVLEGGYSARVTGSGHLVFGRGGDLLAIPIESDTLEVRGAPVRVLEKVSTRTNGAPDFDVSETGTLIYVEGDLWDATGPVGWVDEQGSFDAIMKRENGPIWDASLSPDETRIAMTFPQPGNTEIWTYDIARGTSTRLTFDPGEDFNPIWSPDGEWLAFASEISGGSPPKLHRIRSDGGGTPELLFDPDTQAGQADVPMSWTPDGRSLVVSGYGDIWLVPVEDTGAATRLLQSPFYEDGANVSPDGNWLAYHSNESGRAEVYVQSFPVLGSKQRVSVDGGVWPKWDSSGGKLFYRNGDRMMRVNVRGGSRLELSKPQVLFAGKYSYGGVGHSNYDVARDGRFLMIRREERPPTTRIQLVTNWFDELERLVPVR